MKEKEYEKELENRARDIQDNTLEAMQVLMDLDNALEEIERLREPYPLQTIQSLAERWGVTRQLVNYRRTQHSDFPQPIEGLVTPTAKTPLLFSLKDVEKYEKAHCKNINGNGTVHKEER